MMAQVSVNGNDNPPNCELTDTYVVGNPTQYQQKATQKSNYVVVGGMASSLVIGFMSS